MRTSRLAFAALCAGVACVDAIPPREHVLPASGFLNATPTRVDLEIEGDLVLSDVETSVIAPLDGLDMPAGSYTATVRPAGASTGGATFLLHVTGTARRNLYAYQPLGGALSARVFTDTGAVVPPGKSKVRVVNLAPNADVDIWRTQPDYQDGIRFQFPFPFDPEPGPYFQSDAGVWHVWITPTTDASLRLHETGPIDIPSGQKRTIAVVDSAGVLRLRVLID